MTGAFLLACITLLVTLEGCRSYLSSNVLARPSFRPPSIRMKASAKSGNNVEEVSLEILGSSAEQCSREGRLLKAAVQENLNSEWYEHSSHELIGEACCDLYKSMRPTESSLSSLMLSMGSSLESMGGMDGTGVFDGSFVNAWDVANLVSDYFMKRIGADTSSCNANFPKVQSVTEQSESDSGRSEEAEKQSSEGASALPETSTEFDRYRILKLIMAGDEDESKGFTSGFVNGLLRDCVMRKVKEGEGEGEASEGGGNGGKGKSKRNKRKADLIVRGSFDSNYINSLNPLSTTSDGSICAGDVSHLDFLRHRVLPDEDDDKDGSESMWDIVTLMEGDITTKVERGKIEASFVDEEEAAEEGEVEGEEGGGRYSDWHARSVVVRVLAWGDFLES